MVLPSKPTSGSQISVRNKKPISQSIPEAVSQKVLTTPDELGAVVISPTPTGVRSSDASGKNEVSSAVGTLSADGLDRSENSGHALVTGTNLPISILSGLSIFMGDDGNAYMEIPDGMNAFALRIGSKVANHVLRRLARQAGYHLKSYEIRDLNDELTAHAELSDDIREVSYRVASFQHGVELDLGDARHTRIRIAPGNVAIIEEGSKTLFHRTTTMRPFVVPADVGDLKLLEKYINLHPPSTTLLLAWLGYTLAHAKVSMTSYVILVLQGDQGSGKTFLCKTVQTLVDPSVVGVQTFPRNEKDLVIASQNAHVLFYDNMRGIKPLMSDTLCTAATGGALTGRQLFTNSDQHVQWLHVALVLNGIHNFVDQPDLAQRCLPLHLLSINEKDRLSESELLREFQTDLPAIFRGLLDLIADIMTHLPTVEVTNPERMIDFVRWLAVMEKVDGAPTGVYQTQYSAVLNETMLDSLQENPLAAAVMSFVDDNAAAVWSGTPTKLLQELSVFVGSRSQYSRDWPQTASTLSKRLLPLQAALRRQGIDVALSRGKERVITITNLEEF
jgi:hypothetical protein